MRLAIILDNLETAKGIISKYRYIPEVLFELRLDKDQTLVNLLDRYDDLKHRMIVTLRSENEGGEYPGHSERKSILLNVINKGVGFIDLELQNDRNLMKSITGTGTTPVYSLHDFSQPMIDSAHRFAETIQVKELYTTEPVIFKFVGTPVDPLDLIESLKFLKGKLPNSVILGMGRHGILSRTLMDHYNQTFVFGAPDETYGIPTYDKILQLVESDQKHVFTGLLGKKLSHTLSPQLHQIFREQVDRTGYYHLFELPNDQRAGEFIKRCAELPLLGMNVTFPYKMIAVEVATQVDKSAIQAGSANVISYKNDEITAYNTDLTGFARFLSDHNLHHFNSAVVVGAGSAGMTVAQVLLNHKFDVTFVNRSLTRYLRFSEELKNNTTQLGLAEYDQSLAYDLYINATTIGYDGKSITDIVDFNKETKAVIDLNYSTTGTPLLLDAQTRGVTAFDGKEMLFHQAVDAFEIWTGLPIDRSKGYSSYRKINGP